MSLHFSLSEQALMWVYLFYIQSKRSLLDNFISNETGQVGWAKIEEKLEDHWSCSSPERLSHCKLMRFKLIENRPMKVYAWTLLTPGAWPNLTQGHDWHNL